MSPSVCVDVASIQPTSDKTDQWHVTFTVTNDSHEAIRLTEAWLPHGQFRSLTRSHLTSTLATGQATRLHVEVQAEGTPGSIVDNAFLILVVTDSNRSWRLFVRLLIVFDTHAVPRPRITATTLQPVSEPALH